MARTRSEQLTMSGPCSLQQRHTGHVCVLHVVVCSQLRLEIRWRSPSLAGTATIQLDLTPVPTEQLETVMSETLGLLCDAYSSLRVREHTTWSG